MNSFDSKSTYWYRFFSFCSEPSPRLRTRSSYDAMHHIHFFPLRAVVRLANGVYFFVFSSLKSLIFFRSVGNLHIIAHLKPHFAAYSACSASVTCS